MYDSVVEIDLPFFLLAETKLNCLFRLHYSEMIPMKPYSLLMR